MKEINPTSNKPGKVTRAQLVSALDTFPVSQVLGREVSRGLTGKQKRFALEVAKGATKADAYRRAYNVTSKATMTHAPYTLSKDDRVKNEIEAIQRAISAQEYQTPAALRALVIQSLVGVITNPDSQPGQITAAAKVLGTVTEVAAFTERKEVRTITSSEDARQKIMAELMELTKAEAQDVDAVELEADSLMAELAGSETHRTPTPQTVEAESLAYMHTIPLERSPTSLEQSPDDHDIDPENPDADPPSTTQETPR